MPKIDIETLKFILQRNEPDIRKIAGIMQEIEMELKAEEEEKALRPPAVKKQNVLLVSDPDGSLREKDIVGWIAQIPEEDDIATTASRIHSAAHEFNTTPKGIRMPVETIGEACEIVTAKFFKEQNVWVKSKTPLLIIPVVNKIPTDHQE
ncbi:MAG TPA: hypothetical protein DEA16_00070 [Opitutae bacterium]|jgi:hypothetical protein|nr:hypothetical protein [Opitutae bacterium]